MNTHNLTLNTFADLFTRERDDFNSHRANTHPPLTDGSTFMQKNFMSRTSAMFTIAALAFGSAGPLLAQIAAPRGADTPPPLTQVTKHVDITVRLGPNQRQSFAVPLWLRGSLVSIRFTPAVREPSQPAAVAQAMAPIAVRANTRQTLTLSMTAGGRVLQPLADYNGPTRWAFKVPPNILSATGELQNVSGNSVTGILRVDSTDSVALAAQRAVREREELRKIASRVSKPDLMYVLAHTLDRHLQHYPGGLSAAENRVYQSVLSKKIDEASLRLLHGRLSKMKADLSARLVDRSLLQLPVSQAVPDSAVKKALSVRPVPVSYPFPLPATYAVRLYGVKSWRCADDVGWEPGCDEEEPYVAWLALGPDYVRAGRTEEARGVKKYGEFAYTQSVNVFSAGEENALTARVASPLAFFFQVIESDPGGPSREEVINAVKSAAELAKAIYGSDWTSVLAQAPGLIADIYNLVINFLGGEDDLFPTMISVFDGSTLMRLTFGTTPLPLNRPLFESAGNYDHFSIQIADVMTGSNRQWSVAYTITRQ